MQWLQRLLDIGKLFRQDRSAADELASRLAKPQRHRLLHGYPQSAAMLSAEALEPELDLRFHGGYHNLLIGVLPHPFCNPAIKGCGFCTFPHEPGNSAKSEQVVDAVTREINDRLTFQDDLQKHSVTGLYFGGGTANLTAPAAFEKLCKTLASGFDFSQAEVTLEGVPANFLKEPLLIDIMREHLPARHHRISMGIQTFSESWLQKMGRQAFGNAETFRRVVKLAHSKGLTVSADLLFNLPGQALPEMQDDLRLANDIGLDHLGLYHLVLFERLGTEWSHDPELIANLPSNEQAADNWIALRESLLTGDFYQTTLTNFERLQFRNEPEHFIYEECSFCPQDYCMLGFGPAAISCILSHESKEGIKAQNPVGAQDYMLAVEKGNRVWNKYFVYQDRDLHVAYSTRWLSALKICRETYRECFHGDVVADFRAECQALADAGLLTINADSLQPTPRGMFYADSIAALWAWKRVRSRRTKPPPLLPSFLMLDRTSYLNDSAHNPMG